MSKAVPLNAVFLFFCWVDSDRAESRCMVNPAIPVCEVLSKGKEMNIGSEKIACLQSLLGIAKITLESLPVEDFHPPKN